MLPESGLTGFAVVRVPSGKSNRCTAAVKILECLLHHVTHRFIANVARQSATRSEKNIVHQIGFKHAGNIGQA